MQEIREINNNLENIDFSKESLNRSDLINEALNICSEA
jgi:hypothetical protein